MPLKQIFSEEISFTNRNRISKRMIQESKFEKKWLSDPEEFNPNSSALKREYAKSLKECFDSEISGKMCVDLGSGVGYLSHYLHSLGGKVTAADIAPSALKNLDPFPHIEKAQEFVPYTSLPDDHFDYVIAANLLAELPEAEHRLFFSELSRIAKPDGRILIATPLDINSEDALQKLIALAETELFLDDIRVGHHRLYIRIISLLKKLNWFTSSLSQWFENNDFILRFLQKITHVFYDKEGISYVILTGKRRSIIGPDYFS